MVLEVFQDSTRLRQFSILRNGKFSKKFWIGSNKEKALKNCVVGADICIVEDDTSVVDVDISIVGVHLWFIFKKL